MTGVADIETALRELRRDAARGTPLVRANLLQLVIYCERAADAASAERAVRTLPHTRPSRALILCAKARADEVAVRTIDLSTAPPPDGTGPALIGAELIRIDGPTDGRALAQLASSLLLPDLPVILLWAAAPRFDRPPFTSLVDLATRLVVDSRRFAETLAPLERLRARGISVGDLTWTALTPWRAAIAEAFDDGDRTGLVPSIDRVEVDHGRTSDAPAHLLAGWLTATCGRPVDLAASGSRSERLITGAAVIVDGRRIEIAPPPDRTASLAELLADELQVGTVDRMFAAALEASLVRRIDPPELG